MHEPPCRVIKVGGSLLDFPPTADRLRHWLAAHTDRRHILLAGGGKLVDQVRQGYRQGLVDETEAHWMAIECMSLTARLLQRWLEIPLVAHPEQVAASPAANLVMDVEPWLKRGSSLPVGWSVTSDSIAAQLTLDLGADELLLLKSCPITPATVSIDSLIEQGTLDRQFGEYLHKIESIGLLDFRRPGSPLVYPDRARSPVSENPS
ncbi:MAG: hypothetical protein MK108_15775 [Mariniblastus sp.]|nr:hypothetical protein [Mariniblastus sp.]